jgi:hypothetical protein
VGRAEEDSQLSRGSENTCSPAGKLHAHPSIPRAAVVARCQVNEAALKTRRLPVCAVVDGVVWQCFLGVGMHHISSTQIRTVAFFLLQQQSSRVGKLLRCRRPAGVRSREISRKHPPFRIRVGMQGWACPRRLILPFPEMKVSHLYSPSSSLYFSKKLY